jgi:hypothetical protein
VKKSALTAALIFSAAVLCVFAGIYLFIRYLTVPVYNFSQQPSSYPNFMMSILEEGSRSYVSDFSEFALEAEGSFRWNRIGKTSDGMDIYSVSSQSGQDYIYMTGFMMPHTVFRVAQLPPFDPVSVGIDQITFLNGQVTPVTQDPQIIAEVLASLQQPGQLQPSSSLVTDGYIKLSSSQLKGLIYRVYVTIDPSGKVYFSQLYSPETLIPAGPLFTQWVTP